MNFLRRTIANNFNHPNSNSNSNNNSSVGSFNNGSRRMSDDDDRVIDLSSSDGSSNNNINHIGSASHVSGNIGNGEISQTQAEDHGDHLQRANVERSDNNDNNVDIGRSNRSRSSYYSSRANGIQTTISAGSHHSYRASSSSSSGGGGSRSRYPPHQQRTNFDRRTRPTNSGMESTSAATYDDDDDDQGHDSNHGGIASGLRQREPSQMRIDVMRRIRPRPEVYPEFIREQLRTTHSNLNTLVYTRQTLERIEDIRLEARNLLTLLWHQHLYLVPDALATALQAANLLQTPSADAGSSASSSSSSSASTTDSAPSLTMGPSIPGEAAIGDLTMGGPAIMMSAASGNENASINTNTKPPNISIPAPPLSNGSLVLMGINYNDGSRYEGELDAHRVRQGYGTYFYPSGTVYRGQWNQGSRHGLGICEFVSGNKYVGYWNQGRREGRGVFMFTKFRQKISDLPIPGIRTPKTTMLSVRQQRAHDSAIVAKYGRGVSLRITNGNAPLRLPSQLQERSEQQPEQEIWQHPVQVSGHRITSAPVFDMTETMPTTPEPEHVIRTTPPVFDISNVPDYVSSDPALLEMIHQLLTFEDQERYEGEFKVDQRHGFGVYYFPDGSCYAGMWKQNRRHGKGTYFFTSGRIYEGDWLSSMRHGNGVMRDVDGHVIYAGQWSNDRKDGVGTLFENGDWITALWASNKIEKTMSVQLYPFRAAMREMLHAEAIPLIHDEEMGIMEQMQHIELSATNGNGQEYQKQQRTIQQEQQQEGIDDEGLLFMADPDQQDFEPPDIMEIPMLLPFQTYFRDVDIVTQS